MRKYAVGVVTPFVITLGASNALAVPVPGGTLDPLLIPKYLTPLVIPPVMKTTVDPITNTPTANDYDIAVRQFKQQILPSGMPSTTVWSYGPAADPVPDVAPVAASVSQFNYPAFTIESTSNTPVSVDWINELVAIDPGTGKPYPVNDPNRTYLPHLFAVDQTLHWANPTADCTTGEVRSDCHGIDGTPYTGPVPMVTHLHGAHANPDSDGYTEAWWLPDATDIDCVTRDVDLMLPAKPWATASSYACEGTIANQLTDGAGTVVTNTNVTPGVANYTYRNDQPSTTLWYHDHSLGMTRTNVYAGPAGFWLIRDPAGISGETGLLSGILPAPAPAAGEDPNFVPADRAKVREIPLVIQDRSFNTDGSLFYPDNRAFFEGLNVAGTAGTTAEQFPGAPELVIDFSPQATSDIAPIWNPEAFFNTMVVNGNTWPTLTVAPALYRFRLLNGTNSRFLNMVMYPVDPLTGEPIKVYQTVYIVKNNGIKIDQVKIDELPFYMIGTDQSLMPQVVMVQEGYATPLPGDGTIPSNLISAPNGQQAMLMAPAERADVVIDFRGLATGTTIQMNNTAPDAPFGGFPDIAADPATTGQVMRFVVDEALLGTSPTDELRDPVSGVLLNPLTAATAPESLLLSMVDQAEQTNNLASTFRRQLALIEEESTLVCVIVDALTGNLTQVAGDIPVGGICATVGALPFAPKAAVVGTAIAGIPAVTLWSDPIATTVATDTTEIWDLSNFTVDAHPIHVHLVKYNIAGRLGLDGKTSIVSAKDSKNGGLQAWENGWKDTVIAYPGEVTSVAATFDIPGLYVWHCHIVEHEDNEMMVPFCVGTPGVDCPAKLF